MDDTICKSRGCPACVETHAFQVLQNTYKCKLVKFAPLSWLKSPPARCPYAFEHALKAGVEDAE